jgi:hypothetical protein
VQPRGGSFALLCLLGSASSALAQGPDEFLRTFGTITQPATVQAMQAAWAKLPSTQVGCINDALHHQGGSVEALIRRGVLPSDPRLANERSNCQKQFEEAQPTGSQRSVYAVRGMALGATVPFGSSAYKEYECVPSDQFDGFTWCQKTRQEKERRGTFSATYSILHSRDGVAVYVNRYQEPAFFGANEADNDIQQYSRKLGEPPRITRMPDRAGFPTGILASWGKVELEPLDDDNIKALAEGRRLTTKGYFIDFIGDFNRSAKDGLPIYRLSGGPGFVWVASFDQKRRGTLRLTAVDASALAPTTTSKLPIEPVEKTKAQDPIANTAEQLSHGVVEAQDPIANTTEQLSRGVAEAQDATANTTEQLSRGVAEPELADKARNDAQRAREDAEKERDETTRANAIEKAVATERAKVNAVLAQLQAEKAAAEAKARGMETVAYGTIIGVILLVAIIASAFVVRRRKTATTVEHLSDKREPRAPELSAAAKTEFASTGDSKTTTANHLSIGSETSEPESTELDILTENKSAPTRDSHHSDSKGGSSFAINHIGALRLSLQRCLEVLNHRLKLFVCRVFDRNAQAAQAKGGSSFAVNQLCALRLSLQRCLEMLDRRLKLLVCQISDRSAQAAQVAASLRALAPTVNVVIVIGGTLSAAAIGTALYLKTHRVEKTGVTNEVKASVIGWQENEHGVAAEIIGECVNRNITFKATVVGRDAEPTVELPWNDKLEDYRNETGKFMQIVYLPIIVKINDDEPQIVKRLHEEPYRNVIRLVTLLSEPMPGSDLGQSTGETKTVSVQLDNLLSTAEKAALTSNYPDKLLKISEAKRIMIGFDTSKGTMQIRITMNDPIVQKLVELCQRQ